MDSLGRMKRFELARSPQLLTSHNPSLIADMQVAEVRSRRWLAEAGDLAPVLDEMTAVAVLFSVSWQTIFSFVGTAAQFEAR